MKQILLSLLIPLISGCTTTASDVVRRINPAAHLPTRARIERDLRGCGFTLKSVKTKLRARHPKKFHYWADGVYERLLAERLGEAFRKSGIEHSIGLTCLVSVTITEAKFGNDAIIASPSKLTTRTTVSRTSGEEIFEFPMETGWVSLTSVILPGFVASAALPRHGPDAHAYEITAMAILITRTLAGLHEGRTLDEIELETESGDSIPRSDLIVGRDEDNPWHLAPVGLAETYRIARGLQPER